MRAALFGSPACSPACLLGIEHLRLCGAAPHTHNYPVLHTPSLCLKVFLWSFVGLQSALYHTAATAQAPTGVCKIVIMCRPCGCGPAVSIPVLNPSGYNQYLGHAGSDAWCCVRMRVLDGAAARIRLYLKKCGVRTRTAAPQVHARRQGGQSGQC